MSSKEMLDNTNETESPNGKSAPRSSRCYVPFNINESVRVRLTDHGRKVHRQKHDEFWASVNHPNPPAYFPPDEDEEGWSTWQMWTLMEAFGDHIGMARPNCFDLTIELETSEGT